MRFTPRTPPEPDAELTDEELLAVLRGDGNDGIRRIARKYAGRIRRRLLRSLGPLVHDDDVDSAITEALMVLYRNRAARGTRAIQQLEPYLRKIAWNVCVGVLKDRLDGPVSLDAVLRDPKDPENERESAFASFLSAKVSELPQLEQDLFRIDASREESAERIAVELGTTRDTVYALRYRRKDRFRSWLAEWQQREGGDVR